jgi:hypothetical protein
MAEKTVIVCDVCGRPAARTIRMQVGRTNRIQDLCEQHLSELMDHSRAPRRGRRPGSRGGRSTSAKAQSQAATSKSRVAAKRSTGRSRRTKK